MRHRALRAAIFASIFGTAVSAHSQATTPTEPPANSGPFRTGSLFDLTVGVGSTYNPSSDVISGGATSSPAKGSLVNRGTSIAACRFILKSTTNSMLFSTYQWGGTGDIPILKRP